MAKKSTSEKIVDIASDLFSGKGLDMSDVADLATGGSTKKKSSSTSRKKASNSDSLIAKLTGEKEYPQLSEKAYWAIRGKFQKSIPEKVIASTLTNATGMKAESVKSSVLPALEVMGLIKSDGKPSSLLKAWANDDKYEESCEKILEEVYPSSLRKMGCRTKTEQNAVISWFKKNADVSETAAKKMAAVFFLLCAAELKKEAAAEKKSTSTKKTASSSSASKSGITVSKKGGKATITFKVTVDDDITKGDLKEKFVDAYEAAYKKIND